MFVYDYDYVYGSLEAYVKVNVNESGGVDRRLVISHGEKHSSINEPSITNDHQ